MSLTFEQITSMIPAGSMGFLATVDDNKPEIRGWQLQFIEDNKFFFWTTMEKKVYDQLKRNPNISFLVEAGGYSIRISGTVEIDDSKELSKRVYEKLDDDIKKIYPDFKTSGFVAFVLSHGTIKYSHGFGPVTSVVF